MESYRKVHLTSSSGSYTPAVCIHHTHTCMHRLQTHTHTMFSKDCFKQNRSLLLKLETILIDLLNSQVDLIRGTGCCAHPPYFLFLFWRWAVKAAILRHFLHKCPQKHLTERAYVRLVATVSENKVCCSGSRELKPDVSTWWGGFCSEASLSYLWIHSLVTFLLSLLHTLFSLMTHLF